MSQKTFLATGFISFFIAGAVLFTLHDRALNPQETGTWWAVRFVNPNTPQDIAFEIENYSPVTLGRYTVSVDGAQVLDKVFETQETVTRLTPNLTLLPSERVRIVVRLGDGEKSLTR